MDWNTNFTNMLGEATELMYSGNLMEATEAIQRALNGQGPMAPIKPVVNINPVVNLKPIINLKPAFNLRGKADVEDAVVRDRSTPRRRATSTFAASAASAAAAFAAASPAMAKAATATASPPAGKATLPEVPGSFERITFMHAGARHHYRLYVPPGAGAATPMPLVLMLHGCTQDADDFALGTGMNQEAATANALVLYPAQARNANPNGCWNWFEPAHQHRGQGELALLVAMVQDVGTRHPVDQQRVYAAGLSAGGAMAALLGREYPDVFAAVGVHSGLQAGAADNMMAALSAMNNGAKLGAQAPSGPHASGAAQPALIVFHGDADSTVHAKNGEQLVKAALQNTLGGQAAATQETQQGQSNAGQRFTRTTYRATPSAEVLAEHWVLHNAGHAWSGGNAKGSYTDARGISASQEMLRFFLAHPRKA